MLSITASLPSLSDIRNTLTGRVDSAGSNHIQADSPSSSCHCGNDLQENLYSMKEVSQHCEMQSCWVVVNNVVYDLTDFVYDHPGGMDIMLEHAGTDCTGPFQDVRHSKWAAQLLQKYKIGMLRPEERILM